MVGLAMLGLTCSLGCVLCLTRREGWAALAVILMITAGYSAIDGLALAR